MSRIPDTLSEKIKAIPMKPGVYQMKGIDGNIMYVGKSKSLKSRVKSYFYGEQKQNKIKRMLTHIQDIDVIVTDTHLEAQILECALIKKLKPVYNKQFKNDNNYVYLKIENFNRHKSLSVVHEKENEDCIGPYRSRSKLQEAIKLFQNLLPIKECGIKYKFTYDVLPRPIGKDDFEENKKCLLGIFTKKESMKIFSNQIEDKMKEATSNLRFEIAAYYRDILAHLKYIYNNHSEDINEFKDREILMGEKIDEGYKLFYIYDNRIILKKKLMKLSVEIVDAFLEEGREIEVRIHNPIYEKRDLDFKKIIYNEIKDEESKAILFLDKDHSIDGFIKELLETNK